MYNNAGKFSTEVETISENNFPLNRRLRLLFNSVGGLRPLLPGASPPGGGGVFPPVALASAVIRPRVLECHTFELENI